MDKGIFVALSGAVLQERRMEALTDNLANVNTSGFKAQKPLFEDSLSDIFGVRTFGKLDDVTIDMSQGHTRKTERKLDAAIRGEGFFTVETPAGTRYTRDGSFVVGSDGTLATRDGHPVLGEGGRIKVAGPDLVIDAAGMVRSGGAAAGKLRIAAFPDLSALRREADLFVAAPGAQEQAAGPDTSIEQGYLESSNVNAIRAMTTMIEAMRSYETHAKMIQSMDEMTRKAVEEVGRTS